MVPPALYRVRAWDEQYENNRSRAVSDMRWVPLPNNHDGEGYCFVMAQPNAAEIYAAWILILQVSSRCEPRGVLVRNNGQPHTAATLAAKTRGRIEWFEAALEILASEDVCWLEAIAKQQPSRALQPSSPPTGGRTFCPPSDVSTEDCDVSMEESDAEIAKTDEEGKKEGRNIGGQALPPSEEGESEGLLLSVERIVSHLNRKTGSNFSHDSKHTIAKLKARMKMAGVTEEGIIQMIDAKCAEWGGDRKYSTYLRPKTLFGPENFENYYAQRQPAAANTYSASGAKMEVVKP